MKVFSLSAFFFISGFMAEAPFYFELPHVNTRQALPLYDE